MDKKGLLLTDSNYYLNLSSSNIRIVMATTDANLYLDGSSFDSVIINLNEGILYTSVDTLKNIDSYIIIAREIALDDGRRIISSDENVFELNKNNLDSAYSIMSSACELNKFNDGFTNLGKTNKNLRLENLEENLERVRR